MTQNSKKHQSLIAKAPSKSDLSIDNPNFKDYLVKRQLILKILRCANKTTIYKAIEDASLVCGQLISLKYAHKISIDITLDKTTEDTLNIPKSNKKLVNDVFIESANTAMGGDYKGSISQFCKLLILDPYHLHGLRNFAVALRYIGSLSDAFYYADYHHKLSPDSVEGLNTLGIIYSELGNRKQAIHCYEEALTIDDNNYNALSNLANEFHILADIDNALIYSSKAVHNYSAPIIMLDHITHLRRSCSLERIAQLDIWGILQMVDADKISPSFLQVLTFVETLDDAFRFKDLTRHWALSQDKLWEENQPDFSTNKDQNIQKIKIGFISADIKDHSVARFLLPLFENINSDEFELYIFSTLPSQSSVRKRFEERSKSIIEIGHMSTSNAYKLIKSLSIDVLFDLTGFTQGSRTNLFNKRAASLQASWLGFPGTTGSLNMDYIFLDRYLKPELGTTLEKYMVTNGSSICFSSLPEIQIGERLPEELRGCITFGSLNNTYKITKTTVRNWASIMAKIPSARFLFVRREFESWIVRDNLIEEFKLFGIDASRLYFYNNRRVNRHYLDCYNEIDICLDTYPVTGGTTTIDALWMGVPVITIEGPSIHQRVCSAILKHLELNDWIAESETSFMEKVLSIAQNNKLRQSYRTKLRNILKESLLCDGKTFASDFEIMIKTHLDYTNNNLSCPS